MLKQELNFTIIGVLLHSYYFRSSQKMGKSSIKQIEWLHVDEQLSAKIRIVHHWERKRRNQIPKQLCQMLRVTGPKKRQNIKKPTIHVRNDYEKGSVSHFPGGYHISN